MPPKPKALIAARLGSPFLRGFQDFGCCRTRNGLLSSSTPLAGLEKFAVGGSVRSLIASKVFIRAAEPAAVRRCPMFDLTEPITH